MPRQTLSTAPEVPRKSTGEPSAPGDDAPEVAAGPLAQGIEVVRKAVKTLPGKPGVYRMLDRKGNVLYVGKAKDLKKRVVSYTRPTTISNRIARMVAETRSMEVVTTSSEVEALLLESNLIKRLKPRYNVVLRDDKSFPYILIKGGHAFPQIAKYRGNRGEKGEYFGPFASAGAVNRALNAMQRAFLLRSCSDSIFSSRSRPCLLYQIKRCAGPCVGKISDAGYQALVDEAKVFLAGDSKTVQKRLARDMQAASDDQEYEAAAIFRDRIRALSHIQARQDINLEDGLTDADVIAIHQAGGQTCVQVFFFRAGRHYGNRAYYPRHDKGLEAGEVFGAFLGQFYDNKIPPPVVLVNVAPPDRGLIAEALGEKAGRKVRIVRPQRGSKHKIVEHALTNARDALARHMAESASQRRLLEGVAEVFDLDGPPDRIEVYDNSHIQGSKPVGGMIVAGPEGLVKSAYRKFNIKDTTLAPGDDYGMLREVLTRRFSRALKEDPGRTEGQWPDLVLIDGGKGQLSSALEVFGELGIEDVPLVSIAKGPDRDAGRETFHREGAPPRTFERRDPVLYYLQRLRDEAHRFAIGGHRARRSKAIGKSLLDEVPGVGAARKKALLHAFGSARAVAAARLEDLESAKGINKTVARRIYDHFHGDE